MRFHRTDWDLLPEHAFRPRAGRRGSMTLEGGKGGSAPAPDPALVAAQIKSMGVQDSMAQQIMANSNELQPLQKEQMQFALDSNRTAYDQSQQDRQWMLSRRAMLSGVQDKMAQDAATFDTEAKREELAGKAIGDVNTAFSSARAQSARDMASRGVNPNSGAAAALNQQTAIQQAMAQTGAANSARTQARQEGYAMTDRANNALAGYPAMGMQATGAGAGYGAGGLNVVNAGLGGMNSGYGTAAEVAGRLGVNATGMFGAQAGYKTGQDNVGAGSGNATMGLVGVGASFAASYF